MIATALKHSLKRQLASARIWPAVARLLPPFAVVLAYHRVNTPDQPFNKVTVANFREQMQWLRHHCQVLQPCELRGAVQRKTRRVPVLVTFDDGYRDYLEYACPILREFEIPAVNFVATQYVDDGAMFWWERLNLACQRSSRHVVILPWAAEAMPLQGPNERLALYRACKRHLKALPDDEMQALLPEVLRALDDDPGEPALGRQVMTWDEIRTTLDVTTYGGHLHSHPRVSRIGAARLDAELTTAGARIRAELGAAPTLFAYPDGDVTDDAKTALRRHGYELAFGITPGVVTATTDWMAIERMPGPETIGDLAWRITRYIQNNHGAEAARAALAR